MGAPLPRSAPGVSPHRPSAARGEMLSQENAPPDARFKSKPLCPSPVPVTPACRRSSGLAPVPCPFPGYAMFFTLPAGTPKAIAKFLGDPAARLPMAHLPLADGLRLGGKTGETVGPSLGLVQPISFCRASGNLCRSQILLAGPLRGVSVPCRSTRLLLTLEV